MKSFPSRAEPLMGRRGGAASLLPEVRAKLCAIIGRKSIRYAATLLEASDATINTLREPYGTAKPETVERLTKAIVSLPEE